MICRIVLLFLFHTFLYTNRCQRIFMLRRHLKNIQRSLDMEHALKVNKNAEPVMGTYICTYRDL